MVYAQTTLCRTEVLQHVRKHVAEALLISDKHRCASDTLQSVRSGIHNLGPDGRGCIMQTRDNRARFSMHDRRSTRAESRWSRTSIWSR